MMTGAAFRMTAAGDFVLRTEDMHEITVEDGDNGEIVLEVRSIGDYGVYATLSKADTIALRDELTSRIG